MYGITIGIARKWGYKGSMKELPLDTAKEIARVNYWSPFYCDKFSLPIAFQVFDTAYNGGYPLEWLKEISKASGFGDVLVSSVNSLNTWEVVAKFNAKRLQYLASLRQPTFSSGRMNRIAANLEKGDMQ